MSDIASLGIKIDSNLKILNKDMEKTISLSEKVTDATEKMKAQMAGFSSTTKNVITEEVKRQKSIDKIILSLSDQEKKLALSKNELNKYNLALLGASNAEKQHAEAMMKNIKVMQDEILSQKAAAKAAQDHKRAMESSEKALQKNEKAMADAALAAKNHGSVLSSLITKISALGAAYFGLQAIKDFTKDVVLLSARYETLGVVVENVGKTAGYSMLEINEQSKALQQQGISMIQSRESITKLIQAHIDLSNAQKLGRIAQDAAVIGNVNSSHALERIVYGIQTAQIEVLKSVGLNVNFENSYKKLSIQLGKSTTDLTESEKTQARLNVVLERGADIAGTYESAMTTAGKQITSFTRYLEDFKVIFGQAFNDATAKIVSDLTIYMKEFTGTVGSNETQLGLKQFADGLGVILTTFISFGKAAIEVTKYIGEIGNLSKNLSIEQKGIELVNKGLIDQVKYTKANWEEKKKLIVEAEPITKITKKIGEQTEGYNLYSESVKKSSKALRDAKKEEQDLLDKSLLDQKKARSEAEKAAKKEESEEKARQGRVDAIINKMKEQIATYKQATEVSAEYQLVQEGASPSEIKLAKDLANTIDALKAKIKAQEAYNKVMDKTASDPIELNREKSIEAVNQAVKDGAILNVSYAESLAQINKHFDKMDMEKSDKALKEMGSELDKLTKFDGSSFGNTIADGINNAMISMNKLNDTFDNNAKAQALIIKLQKEISTGKGSPEERKEKLEQIDKAESKMIENQISGYRQLFGTASQLFKENSKEREAMHNIEMAFTAAEIAMNLQKTISAAYTAIMVQGTGDPYSAFARIAAMTALAGGIVAAAGGSLSGGGSGSAPTASAQSTQGTGTVMGSPSDKSQSSSNALEFMKDIGSKQYSELRDINKGVEDLNKNITNLVTNIVRTGAGTGNMGVKTGTSTSAFSNDLNSAATSALIGVLQGGSMFIYNSAIQGMQEAIKKTNGLAAAILPSLGFDTKLFGGLSDWLTGQIGNVMGSLFGGSKKTSILAQGLEVSTAKIGDLLEGAGLDIQKFADIKIKKSGGIFGSDKTYLKTITESLTPDEESIKIMFTNVFKNVGETMVAISSSLNLGEENLAKIFAYTFDIGKIDLKGLDSEQINEAISSVINTASDEAITALFGELIGKYVQIGEGLLQTAIRVVSERAVVLDILEMTGQGFKDSDIPAYSLEITQSLISIAGGIKELQDASATYYDKFFSDEEKQIRLQGQLTDVFSSMGLELPKTRDSFRAILEAQNLTTESGQRNYVTLLNLAEGADKYYSVLEDGIGITKEAIAANKLALSSSMGEITKALVQFDLTPLEISIANVASNTASLIDKNVKLGASEDDLNQIRLLGEKQTSALIKAEKIRIEESEKADKKRIESLTNNKMVELLEAEGKSTEALALKRSIELAGMEKSLIPMQEKIYKLQDEKAAYEITSKVIQERIDKEKEVADAIKAATEAEFQKEGAGLQEAQLENMRAQGKMSLALATERAVESREMGKMVLALKQSTWAMQDKLKLDTMMVEILNLEGKTIEATILQRQLEFATLTETEKPLKNRIYALQDEAKIKEISNNISQKNIEIMRLLGNEEGALAAERMIALASMEPALKEFQKMIYALEDAKKAEEENVAALKKASEDKKALLEGEINTAKELVKKTIDSQIAYYQELADKANEILSGARELLDRSFEAEQTRITKQHEELIAGLTTRLDEAKTAASELEGVFNSLSSARKGMFVAGSETQQYKTIQDQLFSVLGQAQGGNFSGVKSLSENVGGLGGNNQAMFANDQEYKRDFFKTYNALSDLEKLTGTQLTEQQQIVKNIETQIEQENTNHAANMAILQAQYDAVIGVNNSVVSFDQAVIQFQQAQYAADGANALLKDQTFKLTELSNYLLQITNSTVEAHNDRIAIANAINNLQFLQAQSAAIPAFASGGQHYGGLRIVGENGPEMEYTPPSNITPNSDLKSIMSNEEVVAELRAMRAEMARANFEIAKNTQDSAKTLKKFDYDGMPEQRTA